MVLGDRLDVGSGDGGGAGSSSRSGSRASQSYFRSPTLLPTNDRGTAAADWSGDAFAAPRSPISAAVGAGGKLSYGAIGGDAAAIVQRRDSWQSERSISLPALSTLRTSPTALVVGSKGQCHSLTPPPASIAMTPSSTGMAATAYYGRRQPHMQAVSQSLVDAWVLMRQHSTVTAAASTLLIAGGGVSRPKLSRALGERLVVAKQVQRAIDMAESDRRAAAATMAERSPPALSPCRRQAAAPTERGAIGVGGRRRELKFRNIFFNFGNVASSSSFDREESESRAAAGFGEERSRLHETSAVVGGSGSSPTVKKRVRFMDALCWEVAPTPLA